MSESDRSKAAFSLLDPGIQRQLWNMNWTSLRDLQAKAIRAILETEQHLILTAPTAAGKTEAAFLPVLSRIASEPAGSVRALYIGPLKALINDQFARIEELCGFLEMPVHRWHGDVSAQAKKKLTDDPGGVLLITPESLESLFVNRTRHLAKLFGELRFVVVDEMHAFLEGERGLHLSSLLHRLGRIASFRIVGLSATIGDESIARSYVDRIHPESVLVVAGDDGEKEIRCRVFGYLGELPPPESTVVEQGQDLEAEPGSELHRMASDIVRHHAGQSNLVFCNSKSKVEELADLCSRLAEQAGLRDQFLVHHGSLSAEVRGETETTMKSGATATTFCSSTLEMGIDIGSVKAVGQVGPPYSVSSLKQRLGRSGRKGDDARTIRLYIECDKPREDSSVFDRLHLDLVQTVAMMELLLGNWVEPPRPARCDLSTLTQQIVSVIAEKGGAKADEIHGTLCRNGAFPGIEPRLFAALLRNLATADILEQCDDGLLILGLMGEAIRKDKGFYAVFKTPEDYPVLHDGRLIGRVGFIPAEHQKDEHMILARRRWRIVGIDERRKEIYVVPARGSKKPVFSPGDGGDVHSKVRETMRITFLDSRMPAYLDSHSREMLEYARSTFRMAGFNAGPIVSLGETKTVVLTWTGSRVQTTLLAMVHHLGYNAKDIGIGVLFDHSAADSRQIIKACRNANLNPKQLAISLLSFPSRKYDLFISEELLAKSRARDWIELKATCALIDRLLNRE